MADNVKLEDMNKEQLTNAVNLLIQQLQQSGATIRDLGAKVANKEIENSRLRTVLEVLDRHLPQEENKLMSLKTLLKKNTANLTGLRGEIEHQRIEKLGKKL